MFSLHKRQNMQSSESKGVKLAKRFDDSFVVNAILGFLDQKAIVLRHNVDSMFCSGVYYFDGLEVAQLVFHWNIFKSFLCYY